MISVTDSRSTRSSTGITLASTSKPTCRCCPHIWVKRHGPLSGAPRSASAPAGRHASRTLLYKRWRRTLRAVLAPHAFGRPVRPQQSRPETRPGSTIGGVCRGLAAQVGRVAPMEAAMSTITTTFLAHDRQLRTFGGGRGGWSSAGYCGATPVEFTPPICAASPIGAVRGTSGCSRSGGPTRSGSASGGNRPDRCVPRWPAGCPPWPAATATASRRRSSSAPGSPQGWSAGAKQPQ